MNERIRSSAVAAITATVLLLTACAAESETRILEAPGEVTSDAKTDVIEEDLAPEVPDPADDSGAGAPPETLEDYLGTVAFAVRAGGGAGGRGGAFAGIDTDQLAQEQQLIQLEVQTCMQAQGFEYVPEANTGAAPTFLRTENVGLTPAEYAETRGFGISTAFDELFAGEIRLTDDEPSANEAHLETLSEGEAEAWLFALRGEPPLRDGQGRLIDPETGEVLQGQGPGRATGGCQLEAQMAVRGDLSLLGDLSDAWDALEERIAADPRIAELGRAWTTCMLDLGFDYEDADEARAEFQAELRPLLVSFVQQSGVAIGGGGQGTGGGRVGAIQALADQGLTAEQESALQTLQQREIAAAVATLECAGDDQAEIDEIRVGYEAEFITENRELLESFGG